MEVREPSSSDFLNQDGISIENLILQHPLYPQLVSSLCSCRQVLATSSAEVLRIDDALKRALNAIPFSEKPATSTGGITAGYRQADLLSHGRAYIQADQNGRKDNMPKHDVHDSDTMMSDEGDHDASTTHLTDLDQFLTQYIRVLTSYRLDLATVVQEVDQTGKDFDARVAQLLSSAIGEAELSTHFDGHISSTAMQQQAAGSSSSGSQVKKKRVHTSAATGVGMPNSSNNYSSLLHSSAASLLLATADPRAALSSAPYGTGCPDGYLLACKDAKEEEEDAGRAQGFEDVEMQCTLQEASEEDPREVLKKKYADKLQQLQLEFSRKRRKGKLPQAATDVLRSWWEGNKAWPYPTEDVKSILMEQTGLDSTQINNWFINQRKRHWKGG